MTQLGFTQPGVLPALGRAWASPEQTLPAVSALVHGRER